MFRPACKFRLYFLSLLVTYFAGCHGFGCDSNLGKQKTTKVTYLHLGESLSQFPSSGKRWFTSSSPFGRANSFTWVYGAVAIYS